MTNRDYQYNYTDNKVAKNKLFDEQGRTLKAEMVAAILSDYLGPTTSLNLLDLSCSTGIMTKALSPFFTCVTGVDIDKSALQHARENNPG